MSDIFASGRARVEAALDRALPTDSPAKLHAAMRYSVLGGGKRIRALLAYAAAELCNASPDAADPAAVAVEIIHAYSLVHDDLPCMDNDVLRRGKPTAHVAFGEAPALLAGDAMQPLAFAVLVAAPLADAVRVRLVSLLADASGSHGMAGGQAIDLAAVGRRISLAELEHMHRLKTGALIRASVRMGAACGQATDAELQALDRFADALGLAFQVTDDVLDAEGDAATLGKTAGKDAAADKPNYVAALGLVEAKAYAAKLTDEAHAALAAFGERAHTLHALAEHVLTRNT